MADLGRMDRGQHGRDKPESLDEACIVLRLIKQVEEIDCLHRLYAGYG